MAFSLASQSRAAAVAENSAATTTSLGSGTTIITVQPTGLAPVTDPAQVVGWLGYNPTANAVGTGWNDATFNGLYEAANAEVDPENRYLWRMNSGRMEAEIVRDSLLACANRLEPTVGGQQRRGNHEAGHGDNPIVWPG